MQREWRQTAEIPSLQPGQIHIWSVDLDGVEGMDGWYTILSSDERNRAQRLLSPLKGKRFTRARAALRIILSSYFEVPPDRLCFGYSQKGKPYLMEMGLPYPLEFNISHCEDLMLAVVSVAGAVGIDLERIRPIDGSGQIIKRYFSEKDWKAYQLLSEKKRDVAFFSAWTRREALGKAFGGGLGGAAWLDYMSPDGEDAILPGRFELKNDNGWWWLRFGLHCEYIAAAAIMSNQRPEISFLESSHKVLSYRLNGEVFDSSQREPSGVLRV
jgi:4'-phosphopantetheinyl transferase